MTTELKYIHYREFKYKNVTIPVQAVCFGYTYPVNGISKVSVAVCNPKDMYNKKIARAICTGRMKTDDYYLVNVDPTNITHSVLKWGKEKGLIY